MSTATNLDKDPSLDLLVPQPSNRRAVVAGLVLIATIMAAWLIPQAIGLVSDPRVGWNPRITSIHVDDGVAVTFSRVRTSDLRAQVMALEAPGLDLTDIVVLPDGPITPNRDADSGPLLEQAADAGPYLDELANLPGAVRGFPFDVARGEALVAVALWQVVDCDALDKQARPVVTVRSALGVESTHGLRASVQPARTLLLWDSPTGEPFCAG